MTLATLPFQSTATVHYEVVHFTSGRFRLRIPHLAQDAAYGSRLLPLITSLESVTAARINIAARSLIVHYTGQTSAIAPMLAQLFAALQQAFQPPLQLQIPQLPVASPPDGSANPQISANLQGMGWVLLATLSFAAMQAAIRVVSVGIHPFQIAFLSHLFGIGLLAPWLTNGDALKTDRMDLHWLRAIIDTGATLLLFAGIILTPLAQVNALGFTTPLFAMLGATLLLGEKVHPHNWIALALGIVGTLVILRPGLEIVSLGSLLVLGGSVALAGALLIVKLLSDTDSNLGINAYNLLLVAPLTLIPALLVWQVPTLIEVLLLVAISGFMVGGHLALAEAFATADVTAVLPMDFAQLIWASSLGFLLFGEVPDLWVLLGGLLIFAGSTYAAFAEHFVEHFTEQQAPEPNISDSFDIQFGEAV